MNLPFDKIDSLTDDQKRALLKLIAEHGTEYHIYPVSLEQKSIWFLYKRDEGKQNLYYNIRFQVKIRGNVSREQITAALQAVADANQILKARFFALGESVFQYITEDAEICILSDTDFMDGVFDLERKGPFQCKIQEVENGFVLDVAIHHITADGYSIGIFLEDLKKALSGQKITKKGISYFTYSQCQTEPAMKKRREQCIAYWKEKLENADCNISDRFTPFGIPTSTFTPCYHQTGCCGNGCCQFPDSKAQNDFLQLLSSSDCQSSQCFRQNTRDCICIVLLESK